MRLNGKILALLRAGWRKVVALWNCGWNYSVDPPPRHLKVYFWIVLLIGVGGYFSINTVKHWLFPPQPVVSAPSFALAMPAPVCPDISAEAKTAMQQCQSVAFSMTAIAKAQKERIAVLEAEIAQLKAAGSSPANPPVTYKRKRKAVVTSARDEMQKALAR